MTHHLRKSEIVIVRFICRVVGIIVGHGADLSEFLVVQFSVESPHVV